MKSFVELLAQYYESNAQVHERLGQYFCNRYISKAWPDLFYANDDRSGQLIQQWLDNNCYSKELPPQIHNVPDVRSRA